MREEIAAFIADSCQKLFNVRPEVELSRPDEQFGDYATNVALQLAKELGRNPRAIAQAVVDELRHDHIVKAEVAGPGFINLTLSDQALWSLVDTVPAKSDLSIVVETNNPNPFKAMHIGHAFNAILADTIANLLEVGGAEVHRVSYHGDVGSHVGKSMWAILKWLDGDISKLQTVDLAERNHFMSRMYAEGAAAYKENDAVKKAVNTLAEQSFTLDDLLYKEVYETCKAWSFDGIDEVVARLGNKPVEKRYLESEADALGVETLRAHTPGVFTENEGALVFPGEQYGSFNNVFVSSRGRGLYGARDLGLMQLKHRDYIAQKSYIVTAEEQRAYFQGVIKAAELCLPELTGVTTNISTGTVKLTSGKMSSRTGEVIEVEWLFEQLAAAISARGGAVTEEIIRGALRYEFLRVRIGSDVIFDVNESVSVTGNSGPYLQYAYARAQSILNKSDVATEKGTELERGERSLLRKLSEYPQVLERSVDELLPHHICSYLYELAQTFNRFYESNRVIGDERQTVRVHLIESYTETLKNGLELLGIPVINQM